MPIASNCSPPCSDGWSPTADLIRRWIRKTPMPAASTEVVPYATDLAIRPSRRISDRETSIVKGIQREFAQYQIRRSTFAGQWEEVADLILPTSRNTFFYTNYTTQG